MLRVLPIAGSHCWCVKCGVDNQASLFILDERAAALLLHHGEVFLRMPLKKSSIVLRNCCN